MNNTQKTDLILINNNTNNLLILYQSNHCKVTGADPAILKGGFILLFANFYQNFA